MNFRIVNGSISYGAETILEEINFTIKEKDKIASNCWKKWKWEDYIIKSNSRQLYVRRRNRRGKVWHI